MQPEKDPDAGWVAELAGVAEPAARSALGEAARERQLFAHLKREHEREGRESYIEIDAPLELYALVRLLRPDHVVEVGVSSGVSSAYVLSALARNGQGTLHSVDLPAFPRPRAGGLRRSRRSWTLPPGRSSGWAVARRLWRRWDLRLGDKTDVLPILTEQLPAIDLLVYDVPHDDRLVGVEFQRVAALMPPEGVAIVDHGPGGGVCGALSAWARRCGGTPVGRRGLGLYGLRIP